MKSDMARNPPPPAIGDVFEGPPIGHGGPRMKIKKGLYYVRAIVDHEPDDEYDHMYQVVFRFFSQRKGWRYEVVSAFAIGVGLYVKVSKPKRERKTA